MAAVGCEELLSAWQQDGIHLARAKISLVTVHRERERTSRILLEMTNFIHIAPVIYQNQCVPRRMCISCGDTEQEGEIWLGQ